MRNLLSLALCLLLFNACIKMEEEMEMQEAEVFLKCEVDRKVFEKSGAYAFSTLSETDNSISIFGAAGETTPSDTLTLYIVLNNDLGAGYYALGAGKDGNAWYTNVEGSFSYYTSPEGAGGEVEITERTDSRIAGTFNFTGIDAETLDQKVVTKGSFIVPIRQ